MKCCKCQNEIPDDASFCPQCGQSQADVETLRQSCLADVTACERDIAAGKGSRPYIRKRFDERLVAWRQAAELGVREAQWLLARCYDEGFGLERNEVHATSWHLKAAEQGYPAAQNHLGSCYQNGSGVAQDEAEAVEWYRKAAEQGYGTAQANIGWCYDTGSGVAQDEDEAVKWYRKAAEQSGYTSQFNLGVHYEWGSGVEQDKARALEWYRKAADQGYDKAKESLSRLSDEIAGEQKSKQQQVEEAQARYRRACRQALADGKLTSSEKGELKALAESLQISEKTSKQLLEQEKAAFLRDRQGRRARAEVPYRM